MKAILLGDAMIPGEGFGKAWEKHLSKYGNDVIVDNWESDWGQLQYRRLEVEKQGIKLCVSITHTKDLAQAIVIGEKNEID